MLFCGLYDFGNRKISICFNYNCLFCGKKIYFDFGSWIIILRLDYIFFFWLYGILELEVEK